MNRPSPCRDWDAIRSGKDPGCGLQPQPGILSQELLRPDQSVSDIDPIGALDGTSGAIPATSGPDFNGQAHEVIVRLTEIAREIVIGKVSQFVGDRYPTRAFAFARIAHPAVERPDLLVSGK